MIRPIEERDAAADFQTERQPELAEFFREAAWPSQCADTGRTFVLEGDDQLRVHGFYCLTMSRLPADGLPKELRAKISFSAVPVACLTNVARDSRLAKEKRTGETLVKDALLRVLRAAAEIGCMGITLYAMTKGLEDYYAEYGFERLEVKPNAKNPSQLMFLPISDLRASAEAEPSSSP